MKTSLRARLLLSLCVVLTAGWSATALFSYLDARDRIGAMLDDHLVQAAHLLVSLRGAGDAPTRPAPHWGHEADAHSLSYQGWSDDGRLLFRSDDAPESPLSDRADGFSLVQRAGQAWRVYGLAHPEGGMRVLVAEHAGFRDELAGSVARHLLHPVVIALPLLALLVWLAVRWGLRPLRVLAAEVERRDPHKLQPLDQADAPDEVRPLVEALASLFARVSALVESERRFTADAAHELRTPLAAIHTNAEVALAARDDAERRQALHHVTEGTERATRLVGQLLLLAGLDARAVTAPQATVALTDLCARQLADAAPFAASRGVSLGLAEGSEPGIETRGDADLLGVLVRNLVDNAIRYSPRGGAVEVLVRRQGATVTLTVSDSGPGIPAEERAKVLERFYRGRTGGEAGSGLGLSIVSRIATLHGATLSLGDGPAGRGLSVRLELPGT